MFQHIENLNTLRQSLRKVYQLLKPGGTFFSYVLKMKSQKGFKKRYPTIDYLRNQTHEWWRGEVHLVGFKTVNLYEQTRNDPKGTTTYYQIEATK